MASKKSFSFVTWEVLCECGRRLGITDDGSPVSMGSLEEDDTVEDEMPAHRCAFASHDFSNGTWRKPEPRSELVIEYLDNTTIVTCHHCGGVSTYPFHMVKSCVLKNECLECRTPFCMEAEDHA